MLNQRCMSRAAGLPDNLVLTLRARGRYMFLTTALKTSFICRYGWHWLCQCERALIALFTSDRTYGDNGGASATQL